MQAIIAANTNSYHGFSVDEALAGIARAGFKYVELTAVRGWTEHVMPDQDEAQLRHVERALDALGLACVALSGHCNLTDPERLQDFRANMALARRFGAKWIISSTGEAHFGRDERFTDGALIESVRALLPDLEKYDLRLALEVHGDYGTGESLLNIVRTVDSDRVGINYDTANALYYGGRLPGEDIKTCLPRVNYVHLKDKIGGKGVWSFPAVGSGELDLAGFMRYAREGGYGGPFSIEIEYTERFTMNPKQPGDLKVADEAVLRSYEYLHARGLV